MKKIITYTFSMIVLISAGSAFAGNGFIENPLQLKKNKKSNILNSSYKLEDEGAKAFGEGKLTLSLGYGAGSGGILKAILKTYESEAGYNFTSLGPIHFRGEYGLTDKMGLVLSVNHNSWQANWTHTDSSAVGVIYQDEFKRSVTSILARFNFHFGITDHVDPYFGVGAGYRLVNYAFKSTDPAYNISWTSPLNLGFETTLGVRYFFTESFGIYGEIGLAQSFVQGGLAFTF